MAKVIVYSILLLFIYIQHDGRPERCTGFSFMIGEDGNIYEGRGWSRECEKARGFMGIGFIGYYTGNVLLRNFLRHFICRIKYYSKLHFTVGALIYNRWFHNDSIFPLDIRALPHLDLRVPSLHIWSLFEIYHVFYSEVSNSEIGSCGLLVKIVVNCISSAKYSIEELARHVQLQCALLTVLILMRSIDALKTVKIHIV